MCKHPFYTQKKILSFAKYSNVVSSYYISPVRKIFQSTAGLERMNYQQQQVFLSSHFSPFGQHCLVQHEHQVPSCKVTVVFSRSAITFLACSIAIGTNYNMQQLSGSSLSLCTYLRALASKFTPPSSAEQQAILEQQWHNSFCCPRVCFWPLVSIKYYVVGTPYVQIFSEPSILHPQRIIQKVIMDFSSYNFILNLPNQPELLPVCTYI